LDCKALPMKRRRRDVKSCSSIGEFLPVTASVEDNSLVSYTLSFIAIGCYSFTLYAITDCKVYICTLSQREQKLVLVFMLIPCYS